MVKELGMSEKVGLRTHESQSNELMSFNDLSPATNEIIDNEIKKIMQVKFVFKITQCWQWNLFVNL